MNQALRKAIDKLFQLCEDGTNKASQEKAVSVESERLKKELLDFMSYLSASDGTIAQYEAEFLNTYLDLIYTPEELREYIDKNNTYSTEFEQCVPYTLIEFVEHDNQIYIEKGELSTSISRAYCEVFESVAKEFLICDGEATDAEVSDMTAYITMLLKYRDEHYSGPKEAISAIDVSLIHAGENIAKKNEGGEQEPTLEELLAELNSLIGLDVVKKDVNSLIHLQEIKKIRKSRGLKDIPVSNHLVFYGNPGTGKTTVARLLAKIYHAMGILSKGQFVETDRSGLVAGYIGQTALKVQEVVKSALGGVLFIDEAYSLASYSGNSNDYGQEAIDTLLKAMEDNRDDFIVIVAGYPELMSKFIDSNPGLRSRFNKYINFADYDVNELLQIYKLMCENAGYISPEETNAYVAQVLETKYKNRGKNFANAREVRNFFEAAITKQADRLFSVENPSDQELCTLTVEDVKI